MQRRGHLYRPGWQHRVTRAQFNFLTRSLPRRVIHTTLPGQRWNENAKTQQRLQIMRVNCLFLAAILGLLLAPHLAHAQSAADISNPAVQAAASACADDIQKFCAGVQQGGGRIVRCLGANQSALSIGCKSSMLKAKSALGR